MRILIVEDEPVIARDIAEELTDQGYEVISVCINYAEAVRALQEVQPDFAILDIHLGQGPGGLELAAWINETLFIPFIFLTSFSDKSTVDKAKFRYPMAYLVKPFDGDELVATLEVAVVNHARYFRKRGVSIGMINQCLVDPVSPREFEVLKDMLEGLTNPLIAAKHSISLSTVKTHINHLFAKLEVRNRAELLIKIRDWAD